MFLDVLRRRNPVLIEQAIALHQAGRLPANAYVIDLDAVEENARTIAGAADRLGLKTFAMTKQMGRNGSFCRAVKSGGIAKAVAVDMACARATRRAGLAIGHIGHLSQVPKHEADAAAAFAPDYWTVFDAEKANEAGAATLKLGREQPLLARIRAEGDRFYRGHEGGFPASDIVAVADALDRTPGGRFAGVTTFPALLFDPAARKVKPTPNLETLRRAAEALATSGRREIEINAPGTTSTVDARRACRGRRHANRTGTRAHRNDAVARGRGPARAARGRLSDGSFAPRRRRSVLLRRRPLYRSGLRRLSGQGDRRPRADVFRRQRCGMSSFPPLPPSTITE